MAFLIKPAPAECRRLGAPELGHVPGIWSDDWKPEAEAIDYLVAKGVGRWSAATARSPYARVRPLSRSSMLAIGHDLTNFLDWCERAAADWRDINYGDLVEHYQGDMISGEWSRTRKRKLAATTINRRMATAADFLMFAWSQGLREPFSINYANPSHFRSKHSKRRSNNAIQIGSRNEKVRQHPKRLRLPMPDEIALWLADLKAQHGITPYLMAKTVLAVGLRAEEVLLLRASQLPKVPTGLAKTVRMEICYGTKGDRDPHDPEKRGKSRFVRIPVDMLKELHGYATAHRRLCLKKFDDKRRGEPRPPQLFLSKHTGEPLSYSRFYQLWRSPPLPFEHYSPHIGRHTWACYTLIEKIKEEVALSVGVTGPLSSIATNIHQNLIETWISTQLGHVDQRTSEMYLNWVVDQLDIQSHRESWWDYLNG